MPIMFHSLVGGRLLILGICSALAVLLGYLIATPLAFQTLAIVAVVCGIICLPLLIRWHHFFLILSWNATFTLFFLPGQPSLSMVMTLISFGFALLDYCVNKKKHFISVPAITWPLVFLALVILATAKLTGGIGLHSLGSGVYGGRKYYFLLIAILGYFALTSQAIPLERALKTASAYFLSGTTGVVSNIAYLLGPGFYFLFYLFPTGSTVSAMHTGLDYLIRFSGVSWASIAVYYYMLMRYGIRGVMDFTAPGRFVVFLAIIGASTLGGFRSVLLVMATVFLVQFYFEGLFRSAYAPVIILAGVLLGALLVPFADKLPLAVQRSLSFLPIEVDPIARQNAQATLDWRLAMWRILLKEVPKYLVVGKGYAINPTDLYLTEEGVRRGFYDTTEQSMISSDYHNGPLTVLIPFGIAGAGGFLWLCLAGLRVVSRNYRYGDPALRNINTFLMTLYCVRIVVFLTLYGDFSTDLATFSGTLGLSIALNGGVRGREQTKTNPNAPDQVV